MKNNRLDISQIEDSLSEFHGINNQKSKVLNTPQLPIPKWVQILQEIDEEMVTYHYCNNYLNRYLENIENVDYIIRNDNLYSK